LCTLARNIFRDLTISQMTHKFDSISNPPIHGVPTNIVTGFLGAGKTSTILQLLSVKPKHERWAVLVNEFGEIGIDGSIIEGQYSQQEGIYVREVPGGCMCCAAGLPMRVALSQLIRRAKPDRLLIEPTGLGHPKEVLQTLSDASFRDVIEMQSIITVVDARQFSDARYVEHATFQQQISIAEPLVFTEQGVIDHSLLTSSSKATGNREKGEFNDQNFVSPVEHKGARFASELPEGGYAKAVNQGEGFFSVGWRFSKRFEFDRDRLFALLSGIDTERLKATVISDDGCFAYNLSNNALTEVAIESLDESRVEIIAREQIDDLQAELLSCLSRGELEI